MVPGGSFALVWAEGADNRVDLVVRALEPPTRLEWEWTIVGEPPTVLAVSLVPAGGGSDLVLDHSRLPPTQDAGLGAGWDAYLSSLFAHIDGTAHDWDERFMALLPAYREQVAALG